MIMRIVINASLVFTLNIIIILLNAIKVRSNADSSIPRVDEAEIDLLTGMYSLVIE